MRIFAAIAAAALAAIASARAEGPELAVSASPADLVDLVAADFFENSLAGIQAAAVGNWGRSGRGLRAAGLFNRGVGRYEGLSASGGVDWQSGDFWGVQSAAGVSVAERVTGIQTATGASVARELRGVQAATGASQRTTGFVVK